MFCMCLFLFRRKITLFSNISKHCGRHLKSNIYINKTLLSIIKDILTPLPYIIKHFT